MHYVTFLACWGAVAPARAALHAARRHGHVRAVPGAAVLGARAGHQGAPLADPNPRSYMSGHPCLLQTMPWLLACAAPRRRARAPAAALCQARRHAASAARAARPLSERRKGARAAGAHRLGSGYGRRVLPRHRLLPQRALRHPGALAPRSFYEQSAALYQRLTFCAPGPLDEQAKRGHMQREERPVQDAGA